MNQMRLISKTLKYCVKNFFLLFVGAVFPSLIWGFYTNSKNALIFLFDYNELSIKSLGEILDYIMNLSLFKHFYPALLLFVVGLVSFSLLYSAIEHHMRAGRFTFSNPLSKLNGALPAFFPVVVMLIIFVMLWQFVLSALLLLNHVIFSSMSELPNIAAVISAFLIILGFTYLLIEVLVYMLFCVPSKQILGYSFFDSVSYAVKLSDKQHWQIFLACLFPFLCQFILSVIVYFIPEKNFVTLSLFNAGRFFFTAVYFICLSMVGYFDLTKTARKDGKKRYYDLYSGD